MARTLTAIAEFLTEADVQAHFDAAFAELDALEAEARASLARRAAPAVGSGVDE